MVHAETESAEIVLAITGKPVKNNPSTFSPLGYSRKPDEVHPFYGKNSFR
jgi:hypothetical protein